MDRKFMKNNKKGMSLIVLVITILVMIILTGVVVIGLAENNPLEKSLEAVFKANISSYISELETFTVIDAQNITVQKHNVGVGELENGKYKIHTVIKSMKEEDAKGLAITNNKLVYDPTYYKERERKWLNDIKVEPILKGDEIIIENTDVERIKYLCLKGKSIMNENLYIYDNASLGVGMNYNGDFSRDTTYSAYIVTEYIEVNPGTVYEYRTGPLSGCSAWYDENKNRIELFKLTGNYEYNELVPPANAKYVRLSFPGQTHPLMFRVKKMDEMKLMEEPVEIKPLKDITINTVNRNNFDMETLYSNFLRNGKWTDRYDSERIDNGFKFISKTNTPNTLDGSLTYFDSNVLHVGEGKKYRFSYNYNGRLTEYYETANVPGGFFRGALKTIKKETDASKNLFSRMFVAEEYVTDAKIRFFLTITGDRIGTTGDYTNFMFYEVEEGEEDTVIPYIPHKSSSLNANCEIYDLPNKVSDMIFYDTSLKSVKLEQRVGKFVLNGTENFKKENSNGEYTIFATSKYNLSIKTPKVKEEKNSYSTHFIPLSNEELNKMDKNGVNIFEGGKGKIKICVKNTVADTEEEFNNFIKKEYTDGTPVEVYAELSNYKRSDIPYTGSLELYNEYTRVYHTGHSSVITTVLK